MIELAVENLEVAKAVAVDNPVAPILFAIVRAGTGIVVFSIILCLYRMLRGPHLADRVLAGDVLAIQVVALVILLAIHMKMTLFFDAALVVAIIGFASTLAFAQFIGNHKRDLETQEVKSE